MRRLLVISLVSALLGACVDDPSMEELDGEEDAADLDGKADSATLPLRFLGRELILPSAVVKNEVRKVFRTEAELEATLQIDNPGIDFDHEWAVFYAAGNANLTTRGTMARIEYVSLSSTGLTLKVTTALEVNGAGCPDRNTRPFLLVAVPIPDEIPPYTKMYRADRTRQCSGEYYDGVPFTSAQSAASLRACNQATLAQLNGVGITGAQASIITNGRTWASLSAVANTLNIGAATMTKLRTLGAQF